MTRIPATMRTPLRAAPLFLLLAFAVLPAAATTFQVDTPVDLPDGNILDKICSYQQIPDPNQATCSLRAAVQQANAIGLADDPNPIAIQLIPGESYYVGGVDDNEVSGLVGDLDISRPMAIGVAGPLAKAKVFRTQGHDRIFELHAGAAGSRLQGMKLKNSQPHDFGCVVRANASAGALLLERLEILDSPCANYTIGLYNTPTTLVDSEIHHAESAMLVIGGIVTIERSTFHSMSEPVIQLKDSSTATVRYSTFSNNRGAIAAVRSNVFAISSTFVDSEGEHIAFKADSPAAILRISNSLFDHADEGSCRFYEPGAQLPIPDFDDFAGTVDVAGSVFEDHTCTPNNNVPPTPNLYDGSVQLSGRGDHGGYSTTHELLPTSDGIDWIPPQFCQANGTDQRGYPRAVDYSGLQPAHCDAGATELQTQPPLPEGHIFRDGFESD